MITLVITGHIATGKSLITSYLRAKYNAVVFSCDKFVDNIYRHDHDIIHRMGRLLGIESEFIDKKYIIQRLLFDSSLLPKIEKIVFPKVYEGITDFIRSNFSSTLLVFEIPLLSTLDIEFNYVMEVLSSYEIVYNRLLNRGYDREYIDYIMNYQSEKKDTCYNGDRFKVRNDGQKQEVFDAVDKYIHTIFEDIK
ncbi:MAG: dephospho-CoA kinase [Candidatus Xenolissoclinum pacificiensis L6]|uniref:Dephospho-CoA kinase n=1 Tax=Candidatus Xenolissoclinum pacificiensis L6 TaxID=1401685 RepID=W2UYZ5_9RICK|nr:MAG: dephospho-CoA kinase [Candidatus Xenolissoclinum pacificiensis L6]